ncbi:single-stranded DNA-binding protein [candidate division WWE3 bacterium CG08_land_8_20_14_0_20_41_15]|uniref:Single-stranded DNA-binding protein n=1 Tax=candidate division WWE3 bacterium CG08_land_8_20_14_0_20_41_15 TaxID=1975086 RepID=A0A2H0X994_UNCKA|nr:MAG: single-stranded DNA-binding protein [candidate division WWE3 bacterium CG08_land_8_20_14_0_20_41_15]
MSRSLNRAEIIGNMTRDPEMKYTPRGDAVTNFSVATNRQWVTDGETKEEVEFHNVVAWTKLAELCAQLLKKGSKVYISGRLRTRNWDDAQGVKHYRTEIVADDMVVLSRPDGAGRAPEVKTGEPESAPTKKETVTEEVTEEDTKDMPF